MIIAIRRLKRTLYKMIERKEKIQKTIGENIRQARFQRNITQRDLAAWCNFEYSNMSRIESGGTNITISNLCKVADSLEINVSELLKGV